MRAARVLVREPLGLRLSSTVGDLRYRGSFVVEVQSLHRPGAIHVEEDSNRALLPT
jgi:hypothetical protein